MRSLFKKISFIIFSTLFAACSSVSYGEETQQQKEIPLYNEIEKAEKMLFKFMRDGLMLTYLASNISNCSNSNCSQENLTDSPDVKSLVFEEAGGSLHSMLINKLKDFVDAEKTSPCCLNQTAIQQMEDYIATHLLSILEESIDRTSKDKDALDKIFNQACDAFVTNSHNTLDYMILNQAAIYDVNIIAKLQDGFNQDEKRELLEHILKDAIASYDKFFEQNRVILEGIEQIAKNGFVLVDEPEIGEKKCRTYKEKEYCVDAKTGKKEIKNLSEILVYLLKQDKAKASLDNQLPVEVEASTTTELQKEGSISFNEQKAPNDVQLPKENPAQANNAGALVTDNPTETEVDAVEKLDDSNPNAEDNSSTGSLIVNKPEEIEAETKELPKSNPEITESVGIVVVTQEEQATKVLLDANTKVQDNAPAVTSITDKEVKIEPEAVKELPKSNPEITEATGIVVVTQLEEQEQETVKVLPDTNAKVQDNAPAVTSIADKEVKIEPEAVKELPKSNPEITEATGIAAVDKPKEQVQEKELIKELPNSDTKGQVNEPTEIIGTLVASKPAVAEPVAKSAENSSDKQLQIEPAAETIKVQSISSESVDASASVVKQITTEDAKVNNELQKTSELEKASDAKEVTKN